MITTVQRWGNSLAIRIPRAFALNAEMEEHTEVDISLDGNVLVVRPVAREWTLDDLLAGVTSRNIHREIAWGGPVGKEIW